MYYEYEITIPANTQKSNPTKKDCPLTHGILREVSIVFPPGCHRLAHIIIIRFERQLFPTNTEMSFAGDTFPLEFEEYYPIIEVPYSLRVEGWNDDDTYPHTVRVRFGLLNVNTVAKPELRPSTEEELAELLGEYEMVGI
ncbi:hypothetical protein ES705_22747 [subsurface metagenome]